MQCISVTMVACATAFLICVGLGMLLRHLRLVGGGDIERAPGLDIYLPPIEPDLDIADSVLPDNLTWTEVREHFSDSRHFIRVFSHQGIMDHDGPRLIQVREKSWCLNVKPPTPLFLQATDGEKLVQDKQNVSALDNVPNGMLTLYHEARTNKSMVGQV